MPERKIILVFRRTLDWYLRNPKSYRFMKDEQPLRMWDKYLGYDYISFRKTLNDIAWSNLNDFKVDVICNYCYDSAPIELLDIPNSVIVPVDEDDWLSPELFQYLREADFDASINVVTWNTEKFWQYIGTEVRPWDGGPTIMPSCTYGLIRPKDIGLVWSHMEVIEKLLNKSSYYTPVLYAAWIQTVGSAGFLFHNNEELFRASINNIPDITNVSPTFTDKWAKLKNLLVELKGSMK